MNSIADEIKSILDDGESLQHIGTPQLYDGSPTGSGRYRRGSGENPNQRAKDFIDRIEKMKEAGFKETPENIRKFFDMSTGEYRKEKALAKAEVRKELVERAKALKDKGMGETEIGRILGSPDKPIPESTVRSLLNKESEGRMNKARETANFLKEQVKEKGMIDVTKGVELELGVSREKFNQALKLLEEEGYPVYKGGIPQVTNPGKQTTQAVLCKPGTEHKEIYDYEKVKTIKEYVSDDGGTNFRKFHYPASMDSKRIYIRYDEDGGTEKDGIVELRRNVPDLDLGGSRYSQVRILVDGKKYIKGMAVYSDDIPDGYDLVVNSNKKRAQGMDKALKDIKDDPDNPFGSAIKANGQSFYDDPKGKFTDPITGKKQSLSLINKRADEGDWTEWKDKLPSQFLSKQSTSMASKQLQLAIDDKKAEYDDIMSINNPTVKKMRLKSFAEDCDSAAVHLQAAALPRQKYHVIVPINTLKETEVYAPRYKDGEKLALIRYPHGGTFEIPILTVNNKNKLANQLLGKDVPDVVGINHKVAGRLSGADFDGDTVMCIPKHDKSGKVKITSTDPLDGLIGFEPKDKYGHDKIVKDSDGTKHYYRNGVEFKPMKNTQTEMGVISNLITDMTLGGADTKELARAVRHSMVVIDAEKHGLDYKQSEKDNNIAELKRLYQKHTDKNGKVRYGGASTLISRAKGEEQVLKRQGTPRVNLKKNASKNTENDIWYDPSKPEGSLIYKTADDVSYTVEKTNKRTGVTTTVTKYRHQKSTRMAEAYDARSLISEMNTPMERLYANYANTMKNLANKSRVKISEIGKVAYSPAANKKYAQEVKSLTEKLKNSQSNAPKERQVQRLANIEVAAKKTNNPDMSKEDIKKANQQAVTKYRSALGAKRITINISDSEWEAIQNGAISESKLTDILIYADKDRIRELSTPRTVNVPSAAKISKMKSMSSSNYTLEEIAKATGFSTSTVVKYLKGGK